MSLYVVEREEPLSVFLMRDIRERFRGQYSTSHGPMMVPHVVDCNEHDGEWYAYITMPYETIEFDGLAVPLFEGDVERIEWERERYLRKHF